HAHPASGDRAEHSPRRHAAALAELDYGLGAESSSFFYIAINPCPGGGLVLDGNGHRGAMGISGEIGWLPIADGGDG
ncbi:ROK family protein, partial [Rhizobium ruizarguesonis]